MKYRVNDKVWTKRQLLEALYYYNATSIELSKGDIDYAVGDYYYDGEGVMRSTLDNMIIKPDERIGGCEIGEYVHYKPIKTCFKYWPIVYSSFNEHQPGKGQMECILYSKKKMSDKVDYAAIRQATSHPYRIYYNFIKK